MRAAAKMPGVCLGSIIFMCAGILTASVLMRLRANITRRKNKNTAEATFEKLMKFTAEMSAESKRYMQEGLGNEEQLAVFDLLLKPDRSKAEIKEIKSIAVSILQELEKQMREVQGMFSKASARDGFH